MKVSMDKKYKTRDGEPVRLLCTDAKGPYPVVGLITRIGADMVGSWTTDGRVMPFSKGESTQDLIEVQPYDDFKIDEPVMVRDYDEEKWVRRHFAGVREEGGIAKTWNDGTTSFTARRTSTWNQCRRPTPEELKLNQNASEE